MKPTRRAMALAAHGLLATVGRVLSEDDPSILGGSWAVAPASKT
jgi:hypothetical protein